MREHDRERLDDVGRGGEQYLALAQRLGHEPEFEVFEVTQAPVDQLRAPRRRVRRKIVLLRQTDRHSPARGIAGNAHTVDSAANDEQVVNGGSGGRHGIRKRFNCSAADSHVTCGTMHARTPEAPCTSSPKSPPSTAPCATGVITSTRAPKPPSKKPRPPISSRQSWNRSGWTSIAASQRPASWACCGRVIRTTRLACAQTWMRCT